MGISILGGLFSATLALLPLLVLPNLIVFSYLVPLPFFLLGLGVGLRPLLGAGLLATALVLLFEGPLPTAEFFLFSFLGPVFLVHRALLNHKKSSGEVVWYSPSFLLRDFTIFSGIVMIVALGVYLYWAKDGNLYALSKNFLSAFDPQGQVKNGEALLMKLLPFLPGLFAFSWMVMMLLNAAIAQGILVRIKANLRPTPSFRALQIPKSFLIAMGLSLVLSVVGVGTLELLGKNGALLLAFPFFLSGLGIIHFLLQKTSFAKIGLTIFYCVLIFFLWPALLVVLLGMLKPWIEKSPSTN